MTVLYNISPREVACPFCGAAPMRNCVARTNGIARGLFHKQRKEARNRIEMEQLRSGVTIQPPFGSVVLLHGTSGTAWQRFHSDGLWHSTQGGQPLGWKRLLELCPPSRIVHIHGGAGSR
jgi:hypothetical protein